MHIKLRRQKGGEDMDASIIGIALAGFFGLIVLVSFLFGIKRGFKKSLFRFVWLLCTGVILWFTTPLISEFLNSYDLTSFGLSVGGKTVHKLSDIGINLLESMVSDTNITGSNAVQDFAKNFPTMILNVIVFVLLFFILKYLLWIIWAPIASKIFDKDKKARKLYNKRIKQLKKKGMPITEEDATFNMPKKNKYRLLGGVVGVVCGIMIGAVAFSPIIGLNSIYQNVSTSITTTNDEGEEVSFVNSQLDSETVAYINSYQDSVASSIMKYSGTEFVSNFLFSNMATTYVEGEKVKLADEVSTGVKLYSGYVDISKFLNNYQNATKEDLNKALASFKQMFFDMENSKLIYLLGDDLLPIFADKYIKDLSIDFNGVDFGVILQVAYEEYYTEDNPLKVKEVQKQVESLGDIVQLFNDYDLALPLIKGEVSSFGDIARLASENVVGNNDDSAQTFSDKFVDKLYGVSMLSGQYPTIIDNVAKGLYGSLNITGFESNSDIDKDTLKNKFKTIFANTFVFLKYYNNVSDLDFGSDANAKKAFSSLGKIIDCMAVKYVDGELVPSSGILTESSYNGLIEFLQGKANEFLEDVGDLETVTDKLADVNKKSSWETELDALAPLYQSIIMIKNAGIGVDDVLNGNYNIRDTKIGENLSDIIDGNKSVILTNESMREILSVLLGKIGDDSKIKEYLNIKVGTAPATGEDTRPTLQDNMLDAIYDETKGTSIEDWELELYDLIDVFVALNNTFIENSDNLKVLANDDNDGLKNLGQALDKAIKDDTKLFVSNKNLRAFVENFLDEKEKGLGDDSQFKTILNVTTNDNVSVRNALLNNIYNYSTGQSNIVSWETELENLKPVFNGELTQEGDFKESGATIGKVLDDISSSNILSNSIVKSIIIYYLDEQTTNVDFVEYFNNQKEYDEINNTNTYDTDKDPLAIMKNIINNSTVGDISYEAEIGNLLALTDILNRDYSSAETQKVDTTKSDDWNKYNDLGAEFDKLIKGYKDGDTTVAPSKLITKRVINSMLGYYFTSDKFNTGADGLNDAIKNIPGNYDSTSKDYTNLSTIESYQTEFNGLFDLVDLISANPAPTLTAIGAQIDEIKATTIIRFALKDILKYYVDDKLPKEEDWNNSSNNYKTATKIKANIDKINIDKTSTSDTATGDEILLNNIIFRNEFAHIDNFSKDASSLSIDNAGNLLNQIVGISEISITINNDNVEVKYESKLLTKDVINTIIESIMTEKINSLGADLEKEKELLSDPKDGLVANISKIENYQTEFTFIANLINTIKSSNADAKDIAVRLDEINGRTVTKDDGTSTYTVSDPDEIKKSKLFSSNLVVDLVKVRFDKEVEKIDDDYRDTVSSIKDDINENTSFVELFVELETLQNNITNKMSQVSDIETFKNNATSVGTVLDDIEQNMTTINGVNIAKELTKTLLQKIHDDNGTSAQQKAAISYAKTEVENHTKGTSGYYSGIITTLASKL